MKWEALDKLISSDPYLSVENAAKMLGCGRWAIITHMKAINKSWQEYTGKTTVERMREIRRRRMQAEIDKDNIELILAKAVDELSTASINAISRHIGISRNAIVYRMQRRGTNLTKIILKHVKTDISQLRLRDVPEPIDKKPTATIEFPAELVMPLRSYRHCKTVYSNTEARI